MEEQEVNLENLHEIVHENAHMTSWAEKVALTTALFAVFAAISSLLSTHESDQSILYKIRASNHWSYYQAKGIKSMLTQDLSEKTRYKEEQEKILEEAKSEDEASEHATHIHEFFAYAVTLFQVATAVGAIAVLVKKKYFWYASLVLGAIGMGFILRAFSLFRG
jgi:acyl-CoA synthetase (NDP forming)